MEFSKQRVLSQSHDYLGQVTCKQELDSLQNSSDEGHFKDDIPFLENLLI